MFFPRFKRAPSILLLPSLVVAVIADDVADRSESWYTRFEPQLYLYGKAAGVVSDLAVWRAGRYMNLLSLVKWS